MLQLTKIQIASIAVASVLASYVAAGSLAPQNTSVEPQNLSLEQALLEIQYADAAAVDYFLKVGEIEGESTVAGHEKWIVVESIQLGLARSIPSVPGGGAGQPVFQDIFITKKLDKSSPKLFEACARGDHIPAVQLVLKKATEAGGKPVKYLEIKLTDAMVTSYQMGGQTGDIPTDQISLNFTKIEYEYTQTDKKGNVVANVKASYDLARGE